MVKKVIKRILGYPSKPACVGLSNEDNRLAWIEGAIKRIPAGGRILDAGAGEQPFKRFCSHLKYVSQDFALYQPTAVNQGLHMGSWDYGALDIISDIAAIPEPDGSFDAIMCTEVIEHVVNPREALREFSRLVKKDGYLILTAPFCSLTHFAPYHFYTGFSRYFYETELKATGFKIIEITPNGNYFEYLAQEIARIQSIGAKYADQDHYSFSDRKAMAQTLALLENLSKKDKGSSELLCYGYHVFAQKI